MGEIGECVMFSNGRKTIGVFVSRVHLEYQTNLSRGISSRARELGYNVAFFTHIEGYGQTNKDAGEQSIAHFPIYENFAGIITAPSSMAENELEKCVKNNIKINSKCPVVCVRKKMDEYYNVLMDDNMILEDIIRHFIVVHGFTRINFLTGPADSPDAKMRLECYKRVLKEYHIPIEEDRIYQGGDYWTCSGYDVVNAFLSSPLEKPQAIVCSNDRMAIAVCNALADKGIKVPTEIAVSGCDDIEEAAENSPSITTARMPTLMMGAMAVEKIHKHNLGIEQENISYVKSNSIYRESCGCRKIGIIEMNERTRNHIATIEMLKKALSENANMSTNLTGLTTLEEVNNKVSAYVSESKGFSSFYMCLRENWTDYEEEKKELSLETSDNMIMEVGLKNGVVLEKMKFARMELLPRVSIEDKPQVFYVVPLHHQANYFGYVAISFDHLQTFSVSFQAWIINICNALENVRMHSELNRLVYELEDMYIRDALTGLYNRRALEILSPKYLQQCIEGHKMLMVFTSDMDDLKLINDKFGHSNGDIAIKVVADALQYAADDDEICMRCGGDEFTVVGLEYDEEKADQFIKNFLGELDKFNQGSGHDYKVSVSYGWTLVMPDKTTDIEECMNVADAKMYQQKYRKKTLTFKVKN